MVAAAFTLTNCTQEIDAPVEPSFDGVPFEIVAKSADTKTAYDGELKTVWVEGDALNLFHAEAEGTEYENDGEFKLDGENTFKGKLAGTLEEAYCYDWYAIYPYSSYITTPTGSGYSYFGSRSDKAQTQNGNNSMAHIAGANYPLYGVCKDWEYYVGEPVEIEMTHLTCLLEVNVTNNTAEDLLVSKVSFTAPENIVGTFYVNFAGDTPSFTDANYVSKVANLDVQNAAALANGQSAKFYLAVKPFTAAANSEIALSVNGYSKKVTLPAETAFNAGEIKTLNFNYNKAPYVDDGTDFSGEYLLTGTATDVVYAASAYVTGNNLGTVVQIAIVDDKITEVDGLSACKMTFAKVTDGTYAGMYTIKDANDQYLYAASSSNNHLKGKTTLDAHCYWTVTLNDDGTYSLVASQSSNRNVMQFNTSSMLFSCYATASQSAITLYPFSMVVPDMTPRIKVDDTEQEIASAGGELTFSYTLKNLDGQSVSATVSDAQMMSAEVADGIITVTVSANTGSARSATVTLTCGDATPVVLTVSQLGAPVSGGDVEKGESYSYSFTAKQFTANETKTLGNLDWTIAGDGGYWGYDNSYGKGQQFGSSSKPYKSLTVSTSGYVGGVEKVVVKTAGASSISATLVVTVGGVQYGESINLTSTATEYTFSAPDAGMQQGEIKLTYTQTTSKAIYINSIAIN